MSQVKSALGEVVDFEMMRIMEEFGSVNISTQPNLKATTTVDPASLVVDVPNNNISIMGRPEFVSTTVPVTSSVIESIDSAPQITIEQPETVDKSVKATKKGEK